MPRIRDQILDSVFYLYPTIEDANTGEQVGGTGFMVGVPSETDNSRVYAFAVTASHNIREGNSPIIRWTMSEKWKDANGNTPQFCIMLTQDMWIHHPDGDDVAVFPLDVVEDARFPVIHVDYFITNELIDEHDIGPGDEIFLVGRFIGLDGKARNRPTVRFGRIAMMPEPIEHPRGIIQESFVVETLSKPGYSGAPVIVHIPPYSARPNLPDPHVTGNTFSMWLLGVDWGHIKSYDPVLYGDDFSPIPEKWVVQSHSGASSVVPAWKLRELLYSDELVEARKKMDERREKEKKESPATLDIAAKEEGLTRDDFGHILNRVTGPVQSQEQPDPKKRET